MRPDLVEVTGTDLISFAWPILAIVAGLACVVRGQYGWALLGAAPAFTAGFAALEVALGRPDWIAPFGGAALLAYLASPLAIVGVARGSTQSSPLRRLRPSTGPPTHSDPRDEWPSNALWVVVVLGVAFCLAVVTAAWDVRSEKAAYKDALVADPMGETVLSDFQYAPNFNSGDVWTLTGTVEFEDGVATVDRWDSDDPPPKPSHPNFDTGPPGGPALQLMYSIRMYFVDPPDANGVHEITVTCRIQGHDGPWSSYRILDACRDLTIDG